MSSEARVKNEILRQLGKRSDVFIWNAPVGTFRAYDDPSRIIKVGIPGQPDLMAVVEVEITPDMVGQKIGVFVGIETKRPKSYRRAAGDQRTVQEVWQNAIERRHGKYFLAFSEKEGVEAIERVKTRPA